MVDHFLSTVQAHMKNNHQYSIPGQGFATSKEHIPNKNNLKCQYCAKMYSIKQEAEYCRKQSKKIARDTIEAVKEQASTKGLAENIAKEFVKEYSDIGKVAKKQHEGILQINGFSVNIK